MFVLYYIVQTLSLTSLSGFIRLRVNQFIKGKCKLIFLNLAKINHSKQPLYY